MEVEGRTIILSTPEELLPLITEAVRIAGCGKTTDDTGVPGKKLLAPKDVEREFGIHQKTLAYWRTEGVGVPFMNVPCWKSISHRGVSKPRNQSDDGLLIPIYPL